MWGDVCSLVSHICIYFREGNTLFQRESEREREGGWWGSAGAWQGQDRVAGSPKSAVQMKWISFFSGFIYISITVNIGSARQGDNRANPIVCTVAGGCGGAEGAAWSPPPPPPPPLHLICFSKATFKRGSSGRSDAAGWRRRATAARQQQQEIIWEKKERKTRTHTILVLKVQTLIVIQTLQGLNCVPAPVCHLSHFITFTRGHETPANFTYLKGRSAYFTWWIILFKDSETYVYNIVEDYR